jgi:hypothetical protein
MAKVSLVTSSSFWASGVICPTATVVAVSQQ